MTHDDDARRRTAPTYPISSEAAGEVAAQVRLHARSARELADEAPGALRVMFAQRARLWTRVAEAVEQEGALDALLAHAPEDAA